MSRTKILLLLGIIALIHVVVIYCCILASGDDEKNSVDPLLAEAIFNQIFNYNKVEKQESVKGEKNNAAQVTPWDYSRCLTLPAPLARQAAEAKGVIIVDLTSRRVLYEKNARNKLAIASLTKLMTLLVIADKMSVNGKLPMNTMIDMSKEAASVEYARLQQTAYSFKDLVHSMIVGSYNDAATQLAISCCGSVEAFVAAMNQRAAEMGLAQAEFNSPSGLPQGADRINAFAAPEEVLHLCEAVMKNQELSAVCATARYKLNHGGKRGNGAREISSGNQMINGRNINGAFGFKTGFTSAAGRCVAFGVRRNGRVILCCITGYSSNDKLFNFGVNLTDWAFKQDR